MRRVLIGLLMAGVVSGCASGPITVAAYPVSEPPVAAAPEHVASEAEIAAARASDAPVARVAGGAWIGAAGASDFVIAGTSTTTLGVWVDVPKITVRAHAPSDVALVIDTSGSMAGPKIENARAAARELVGKLPDGDILSISTFANEAEVRVAPTILSSYTRPMILSAIAAIQPVGGTNMFEGLRLGEDFALKAPPTHPVRRVVVISDGMANVGPSSPEVLGSLAARGADRGVQVTAIGVGIEYDETTLNALAVRSSGRLYHINEPHELPPMMDHEIALLQQSAATNAWIEIVPAAGVELVGADGVRTDRSANGSLRVPLGTMFGGQHRELALRVRVTAASDGAHPMASVRLHFNDPADGNLERVQEVVARYQVATDLAQVEAHLNVKTQTIVATQEAAWAGVAAARDVNDGRYEAADRQLAQVEAKLKVQAEKAKSEDDRRRVMASMATVSQARSAAKAAAAPAAPPAMRRAKALEINHRAMDAAGF